MGGGEECDKSGYRNEIVSALAGLEAIFAHDHAAAVFFRAAAVYLAVIASGFCERFPVVCFAGWSRAVCGDFELSPGSSSLTDCTGN